MADYNHRAAFALALRPISPALAALHAVHLKRTTAELLTPLTCAHCGHAPVQIRSRKSKSKTKQRVVERTCEVCAFVDAVPVENAGAARFKSTRITRRKHVLGNGGGAVPVLSSQSTAAASPSPTPTSVPKVTHTPPPPTTTTPASTSKRPKKKSGLQELLARNRERQVQQQQQQQRGTGLTSFLDGL